MQLDIKRKLPFKNGSFDKVLCTLVVNHISKLEKLLAEVHRVLKKKGLFVYDDLATDIERPFKTKFNDILQNMSKKGYDVVTWHTLNDHINFLHRLDFEINHIKFIRINKKLKHTLSEATYKRNEGRTLSIVFQVKK